MQRVPEEEKFSIVFVQLLKSQTIELPSLFIVDNIRLLGIFLWFFYTYDFHTRESIRERNAVKRGRRDNRITMIAFSGAFSISIPLSPMESYTGAPIVKSLPSLLILFFLSCKCDTVPRNVASTIVQQGRYYFRCTDCKFLGNRFLLYIPVQAKNTAWSFSESELSRSFLTMIGITDAIRIAYFNTE